MNNHKTNLATMKATQQEKCPFRAAPQTLDIRGGISIRHHFLHAGEIDGNDCWGNFFVSLQIRCFKPFLFDDEVWSRTTSHGK
jgi:hypothetical protein